MPSEILISSFTPAFRDLIRLSLEDYFPCTVYEVQSCSQAVEKLKEHNFDLVIIDADLREYDLESSLPAAAQSASNSILAIFPPGNNPDHPAMEGISPNALLRKPFYLPELHTVLELLKIHSQKTDELPKIELPKGKQSSEENSLNKLIRGARADGLVILKSGIFLETSEGLPPEVSQEITAVLSSAWQAGWEGVLIRYVTLESAGCEKLIYATSAEDELLFGFVFPLSSPLSQARKLAHQVLSRLKNQNVETIEEDGPQTDDAFIPLPAVDYRRETSNEEDTVQEEEDQSGKDEVSTDDIVNMQDAVEQLLITIDSLPPNPPKTERESTDTEKNAFQYPWERESAMDALSETPPKNIPLQPVQGELPEKNVTGFAYTCILIPYTPEQLLDGPVAEELQHWVPQFCANLGWKLENLEIHPQRLQWTVEVSPGSSAGQLVHLLRKQSSIRLAKRFSALVENCPDGDFWAPGHLIVSGRSAPAQHLIDNYALQTRRRQGLGIKE